MGTRLQAAALEADPPAIASRREDAALVLELSGAWTTQRLSDQQAALDSVDPAGFERARIDLSGLAGLDTAGAWLVQRTRQRLAEAGLAVEVTGASAAVQGMMQTVAEHHVACPEPPPPENPLIALVHRVGYATFDIGREARDLLNFLGLSVMVLSRCARQPWRIPPVALASHMERTGLNALPIIGLIAFLIGVVLAYQGADQLARFGAQIYTVNLVGLGVLREMGILLTAIMVAGRSGSAFTAQIGTMVLNEEVDAMRSLGLDPMEILVIPRMLALILVMPLLTFFADILGLLGGAVMTTFVLEISPTQFIRQLSDAVPIASFWVGMIKAPLFAFIIGMVGCYEGLKVSRSAESVGRQTTRAVVESVFLVIVLDALLSILFSVVGI